jgi:DNA-binding response OmpR family regulator
MATILCADDEDLFLDLYSKLFELDGHTVVTATSGQAVLEKAGDDIDLVVLDVAMPGLDGIETCLRLRDTKSARELPVIIVSGLTAEETIEMGYEAGANDYVLKPFQPDVLVSKVNHLLAAAQVPEALPEFDIGDTFNERYAIRRKVDEDELVTTYLAAATDVVPPQTIILALYAPTDDDDAPVSYQRDVQMLTRHDHVNMVDIYDHGCADGIYFSVTEYVDGTLRDLVERKGRMTTSFLGVIAIQLLHLLEYFKYKGIVHRGLTPDTIQLTAFADAKISDFRFATTAEQASVREYKRFEGDAEYSAPEYLGAKALDHACDIYSVGAAMYFAATGEAPYQGDNQMGVLLKQHRGAPRKISDYDEGFGEGLADMIACMIHRDPALRPSVAELIKEIDVILATTQH